MTQAPTLPPGFVLAAFDTLGSTNDEAKRRAGKGDIILITGSFFLAGELRALWFPEKTILKNRYIF